MTLPFDAQFVFDPFTLTALLAIAAWLDRRLRQVEKNVAYERGYMAGQQSLKTHSQSHTQEKHDPASPVRIET